MAAKDPYRYFRVEGRELHGGLAEGALALEKGGGAEAVQRLLRLAHTLKGAARVVRQTGIADEAHAIEELLAPLRDLFATATIDTEVHIDAALIRALLGRIDRIDGLLGALDAPAVETAAATLAPPPAENLNVSSHSHSSRAPAIAVPPIAASPIPAAIPAAPIARPAAPLAAETVRVELAEMDALLRGVAETAVQLESLRKQSERLGDSVASALATGFTQVERELGQVRDSADRMRLVPVETLAPALERAARDAAELLGKQVQLDARSLAGDSRLEAHVLARLSEALLHVVRNAVAHGVEKPDERRAAGKPDAGRIELSCARRGARLTFTCRDDGRGLDLPAIRSEAIRRGLLSEAQANALSQEQAIELLLRGGLSTNPNPDAASGRGVGLDVVRAALGELRGSVKVSSTKGHGTAVELEVPVSLSAMGALQAIAGDQRISIPLAQVARVLQIDANAVTLSEQRASIELDGRAVPLLQLWRALGRPRPAERKQLNLILVNAKTSDDAALIALQAEELLGAVDLVVRPLPPMPASPLVAGASLDADGNPNLLLDPEALARAARAQPPAAREEPEALLPILIVDDSLTTRMLEQSILESAGFSVETATSAEEGLDKARANPHGLFLVDVEMPGMTGFEFVARTQADPQLRGTPAILVSSRNGEDDFRRGREAGARGYMVKGEFDQNRLLAQIRELMVRR